MKLDQLQGKLHQVSDKFETPAPSRRQNRAEIATVVCMRDIEVAKTALSCATKIACVNGHLKDDCFTDVYQQGIHCIITQYVS